MNHRPNHHARRAFSLLELLVVIVIIAILLSLVAGAGIAVLGNQKVKQAENLLTTLDRALTEYMTANNDNPPPYIRGAYVNTPGTAYHPTSGGDNDMDNGDNWADLDGDGNADPRHPDAAVFVRAVQGVGAADSILEGIADRWLVATPETGDSDPNAADGAPSVLDPWSSPEEWGPPWPILGAQTVYYVHPRNELAQRLYGRCLNGRPYFMSAGPDGIYGSTTHLTPDGAKSTDPAVIARAVTGLEDNVYSYEPGAPDTSDDFNQNVR